MKAGGLLSQAITKGFFADIDYISSVSSNHIIINSNMPTAIEFQAPEFPPGTPLSTRSIYRPEERAEGQIGERTRPAPTGTVKPIVRSSLRSASVRAHFKRKLKAGGVMLTSRI